MATNQIGVTSFTGTLGDASQAHTALTVGGSDSLVAPESGTCTKMFIYIGDIGLGTNTVHIGIYDDNAGTPNNLLGAGFKTGGFVVGWNEITISSVQIISGNTYYPVSLAISGDQRFGYNTGEGYTGNRRLGVASIPDPYQADSSTAYSASAYFEYDGSVSGFTLTAETGILSITGQTAALKLDRKLIANSGSLSIIGNEASLTINRILQANSGTLTITGQDANLVYGKGYILSAEAGSITITGQPVSLTKTNALTAESGSLNISGKNVILTYSGAVSAYYEIVSINGALTTKTTLDARLISIKSINGQAISIEDIEGELI